MATSGACARCALRCRTAPPAHSHPAALTDPRPVIPLSRRQGLFRRQGQGLFRPSQRCPELINIHAPHRGMHSRVATQCASYSNFTVCSQAWKTSLTEASELEAAEMQGFVVEREFSSSESCICKNTARVHGCSSSSKDKCDHELRRSFLPIG